MSYQVNTPFYNPLSEETPEVEVEVIDATHPLFGRRFPLISVSRQPSGEANAYVGYRDYMTLRIPLISTDLGSPPPSLSTKLSLPSLNEIITLFKDSEELCHIYLTKHSATYPPNSKEKFGRKS